MESYFRERHPREWHRLLAIHYRLANILVTNDRVEGQRPVVSSLPSHPPTPPGVVKIEQAEEPRCTGEVSEVADVRQGDVS